ncbi:MAG: CvpA family protein [Chloroflexi bacterium]|nr:CvpA family protein [Chloroflexota bacterium]
MNWLDGAIIALIIWMTYAAFKAGFIRETVTVVAVILGIILAGLFYQDLAEDVLVFIDNPTLASIVGFAMVLGAVVLAGQMLASILKPTVNLLQLGIFDQMAGAAFGFVKAIVFIQIFLILFITYPKWGLDETIHDSVFGSLTVRMVERVPLIVQMLPAEFEDELDRFVDQL